MTPRGPDKPMAPVDVNLTSTPLGGGDYEVTLTATPRTAVPALELILDGQTLSMGATASGQPRSMTTRIHVESGDGRDVAAGAAVGIGNHRRSRGAFTRLGIAEAKPVAPTTLLTLPDGTVISEVRQ